MPAGSLILIKPEVTVAAIIEQNGRFLMVEEQVHGRVVFNQPAGHLEAGENFTDAVIRETQEETGRRFRPHALVGIYLWPAAATRILRLCFCGDVAPGGQERGPDPEIITPHWLDEHAIAARAEDLRSPLVLRAINDYRAGNRYPLEVANCLDTAGACR